MSKKPETTESTAVRSGPEKPKPVAEVRLGDVRASIWANRTEKGVMYNATFDRRFKAGDKKWRSTTSFGRDDLMLLSLVVDNAMKRIEGMMARDAVI